MRRSKIGDVYAVKLQNGCKLLQRAYDIPRVGRFIRVFKGLYKEIPDNIQDIVSGPHEYIISFHASRAYRMGQFEFVCNCPVPVEHPLPEDMFYFCSDGCGGISMINVTNIDHTNYRTFRVSRMEELPEEFRNLTLLSSVVSPDWLLYLFDTDWSPSNLPGFFPGSAGEDFSEILRSYSDMVKAAQERERL